MAAAEAVEEGAEPQSQSLGHRRLMYQLVQAQAPQPAPLPEAEEAETQSQSLGRRRLMYQLVQAQAP